MKKLGWFFGILVVFMAVYFGTNKPKPTNTAQMPEPEPTVYEPVVYDNDIKGWTLAQKSHDVKKLMAYLGIPTTDEDGVLDFYGDVANRYRFSALHEPPLYLLLGDGTLELGWYYAHAKDDDGVKAKSKTYAQKVHTLMSAIYGEDATALMQAILGGKQAPRLMGLRHAKCQAYQCQIVLDTKTLNLKMPSS